MIINDPAILALLDNHWTAAAANAGLPPPVRRAKMLTALSAVLLELVSQGYGEKAPATGNEHHAAVIHNVLRHMLESGGRQLSTEQLARIAGYSKYHFLRLFKKHSGRTVRSCIDDCCLARIATLRQAGKNHSEVAAALGFSSLTVYSRWRKRAEQKRRP